MIIISTANDIHKNSCPSCIITKNNATDNVESDANVGNTTSAFITFTLDTYYYFE